jgi:hypothetical protein
MRSIVSFPAFARCSPDLNSGLSLSIFAKIPSFPFLQ